MRSPIEAYRKPRRLTRPVLIEIDLYKYNKTYSVQLKRLMRLVFEAYKNPKVNITLKTCKAYITYSEAYVIYY